MVSYWEKNTFWSNVDMTIVGSGIVGLFASISYKKKHPEKRVVVLDSGMISSGASTKNAGFACIGSASELLDDMETQDLEEIKTILDWRIQGLKKLRDTLGDSNINYQHTGNFEVFNETDTELFEKCAQQLNFLNDFMKSSTQHKETFSILNPDKIHKASSIKQVIHNQAEGLIDTGKMMKSLITLALSLGIEIYGGATITNFEECSDKVVLSTSSGLDISSNNLLFCTNAFSNSLLQREINPEIITPFRNQVYVYHIPNHELLPGGYHFDRGYVYYRTLPNNRILIGGGRNLALNAENTTEFGTTRIIEGYLKELLAGFIGITPTVPEIKWSGILASGNKKMPIVRKISDRVGVAVRMGGMGIAIGSIVGEKGADLF